MRLRFHPVDTENCVISGGVSLGSMRMHPVHASARGWLLLLFSESTVACRAQPDKVLAERSPLRKDGESYNLCMNCDLFCFYSPQTQSWSAVCCSSGVSFGKLA